MRKLVFVIAVLYTLCIAIDMTSTVLVFSQFPNSPIKELHPWGYPLCLFNLIVYPVPAFLICYGIARVKNLTLCVALASLLMGVLTVLSIGPLRAASSNMRLYSSLRNQMNGGD